jgi:SagB-type dehydrogenase family enzyme
MDNRQINATWKYHNITKHPGMPPHYMDWENQPVPFKIYKDLDSITIPVHLTLSDSSALMSISKINSDSGSKPVPDLSTLGRLLYLCAGITKKVKYPGGDIYFRAAACTGALYHIDLYVVSSDINELDAGVYHFSPHDFSLRRLRKGDFRGFLSGATAGDESIVSSPVTVVCASTFWRNSWKYQARAYRHIFWDSGTIIANLLAACFAYGIQSKIVLGFIDSVVNILLGLDVKKEVSVILIPLSKLLIQLPVNKEELEEINYETMPLSQIEIDYPSIREIHLASSLITEKEVSEWSRPSSIHSYPKPKGNIFNINPNDDNDIDRLSDSLENTILRRGSTRNFERISISYTQLSNILYRSTRGIPSDFLNFPESTLNDIYLIVNEVEGIPQGSYFYNRERNVLELLREGNFRRKAAQLGLGQQLPGDASVNVFFLADLNSILEKIGNRGYRAAQLEAGIIGGKLYLAAYGLGLGASGLTFFDDEVTRFFSPHAEGKSAMFLVALGKSVKKK